MAIRRFSTSNLSGGKSSKLWDQETTPGYYESIATVIVPSAGASTVTFSNIPQNYTHLQLRVFARGGRASDNTQFSIRLNSDSTSNYVGHYLIGQTTAASSGPYIQDTVSYSPPIAGNSSTANVFGAGTVDILDYTNTNKNKTLKYLSGYDANGSGWLGLVSSVWLSTAAISTITITETYGNNLLQYSSFALYGIRGA